MILGSINRMRMKLRIKFSKRGPVKFVGHLDFMRYFQKCIRRAGLDIAYSKGFSPHQIMSFALALGVGVETDGEYLDIEVNSLTSCEDYKDRLNAVMADGVKVLKVSVLDENSAPAMSVVAASGYELVRRDQSEYDGSLIDAASALMSESAILIKRENKKAKKKGKLIEGVNDYNEIDIKPGIYDLSMDKDRLYCLVDASSAGNIRPMEVLGAIYEKAGLALDPLDIQIIRTDTYMYAKDDATENPDVFTELDESAGDSSGRSFIGNDGRRLVPLA